MRAIWMGGGMLVVGILAFAWPGAGQQPPDARPRVVLAPAARDKILAEMRGRGRQAGGPGAAAPPPFLRLGMQTRRAFDALADQLKAGTSGEEALKALTGLTGNCVACHATYRLDEAR